jgi:hypothetical protein
MTLLLVLVLLLILVSGFELGALERAAFEYNCEIVKLLSLEVTFYQLEPFSGPDSFQ